MAGKRSKSKERERKRLYRQNRTTEQIELDREKDRNKKKEDWSKKIPNSFAETANVHARIKTDLRIPLPDYQHLYHLHQPFCLAERAL